MACIYHIYSTDDVTTMYIGQTRSDPEPRNEKDETTGQTTKSTDYQARPMDHFSGLYDSNENPMFLNWVKQHALKTMVVEIYDEANYFGLSKKQLDKFCAYWFAENVNSTATVQGDQIGVGPKGKIDYSPYYLDAAEIMHNYIAHRNKNYKLLTYQIGGQRYSLKGPNGIILNTTTSVENGCNILENGSDFTNLEAEFQKELSDALNNSDFLSELSRTMAEDVITNQIKQAANSKTSKSTHFRFTRQQKKVYTQILAKYIRIALLKVQKGYAANLLRDAGYQINTIYDNLYSQYLDKWLVNFNGSQHYNIIDAMIDRLSTNELRNKLDKKQYSLAEAIQEIGAYLSKRVSIVLPDTSVTSFFEIIPPEDKINPFYWDWGAASSIHYADSKTDAYALSFRRRAYWAFRKAVSQCLQTSPEISETYSLSVNDGLQIVRIATYRLLNALTNFYKNTWHLGFLQNDAAIQKYLRPMMTIYTKSPYNETTIGSKVYAYQKVDNHLYLITDQVSEFTTDSFSTQEEKEITTYRAYRFGDEFADTIKYWADEGTIEKLENY